MRELKDVKERLEEVEKMIEIYTGSMKSVWTYEQRDYFQSKLIGLRHERGSLKSDIRYMETGYPLEDAFMADLDKMFDKREGQK